MSYQLVNYGSNVKDYADNNYRLSSTTGVIDQPYPSYLSDPNNCHTCVDDYAIPPCTGFSKDYSCLPQVDSLTQ